ncbi:osmotically-inducible protein OsmY [Neisseria sp. HSC-16F19]|nr:BON domain-containing protein [Neisseria sp. HSC-16F19]MCP2041959.1 osmotically-inducible protein OsmY [Neisseria sp. HSC-16F19]
MKKTLATLLLAALMGGSLSACVPALIGGAAIGTVSATDRRSTGAQADDQVMELRIKETAQSHLRSKAQTAGFTPKLSVVSYNRQVLLLGLVATEEDKAFVERVARAQPAAQKIYNYIEVAQQGRSIGNVADDSWITSKVRTTLLNVPHASPNHVKVVTYNGITYVMGVLTPTEQESVTQVVSTTAGVQKVITLYQTFDTAAKY